MNAIVAMLDPTYERRVYDLWEELETKFKVRGVYITPYPHFTFQGAASYQLDRLPTVFEQLAVDCEPFTVQTSGLGLFTGESPVLFVPVKRTPTLNRMHERVWDALQPIATDCNILYDAAHWVPHITIGFGDMRPDVLSAICTYLADRDFNWEIEVDSIAFIHNTGNSQLLKYRTRFGGNL